MGHNKYGGFDESVYGFSQFKQLMEEGERLGYFKLGVDNKQANYAFYRVKISKTVFILVKT